MCLHKHITLNLLLCASVSARDCSYATGGSNDKEFWGTARMLAEAIMKVRGRGRQQSAGEEERRLQQGVA